MLQLTFSAYGPQTLSTVAAAKKIKTTKQKH
jgi:hypothetical protein